MSRISSTSSGIVKRVRFSPDCKDADDYSTPILPNTPRRLPGDWQMPSPPLSDSSSLASESEVFMHTLLLPRGATPNPILYDIRCDPSQAIVASLSPSPLAPHLNMHATQPVMKRIQLISRWYPWTIIVENPTGVTIGDVLSRIRTSAHKNMGKPEFESVPSEGQAEILKAYQRNCLPVQGIPSRKKEDGLKRVDWLGRRTLFAGIQKDDRYINSRVFDEHLRAETFVIEFALSS